MPVPPTSLQSIEDTDAFAAELARSIKPGDSLGLTGNLGAGKTHLAKFLVAHLGVERDVSSPTFTLINEYNGSTARIAHFDFYRIKTEQELIEIGWDDYHDNETILIVEWANRFPAMMAQETRWFDLRSINESTRLITELTQAPEQHIDD